MIGGALVSLLGFSTSAVIECWGCGSDICCFESFVAIDLAHFLKAAVSTVPAFYLVCRIRRYRFFVIKIHVWTYCVLPLGRELHL